ncbi:unnamed protein product [Fusarium graminearum]|uniref:Chromosome 1, complete genome n=2 Tax=Gibberella zeae TaxID=5518 RepID=A0A098DAK3_GIBZE|nr:unnamed protein product [Fusarium graminearum]CAG1972779.1 unnamed protein product [Fusarium graminearum]CEF74961.1 unnamed protein product [Fusarium graminearum]CZS78239.1 unnamed protein product [Fusarium graminearum]
MAVEMDRYVDTYAFSNKAVFLQPVGINSCLDMGHPISMSAQYVELYHVPFHPIPSHPILSQYLARTPLIVKPRIAKLLKYPNACHVFPNCTPPSIM